jgi:hypothetical protein
MNTVGYAVSRVRNVVKSAKIESFLTDRFLYSLIMKYASTLMLRDSKNYNLFRNTGLFKEAQYVELVEVDKFEACGIELKTNCTIRRTAEPLAKITNLANGPLIRLVTTIDGSAVLNRTEPGLYANMTKTSGFKYNKQPYYWIVNNYLYVPNVDWEAIKITAMFEESISKYTCDGCDDCVAEQDRDLMIPDSLFSEIEGMIQKELNVSLQIPMDNTSDNKNMLR